MSVEHYDFIIVGSGFGGAVAAHKLVQTGARVLLLGMDMPPNYGAKYAQEFREVYSTVARTHQTALVPFFLKGVADGPDPLALFQSDRIHPNEQAQPRMRDNVWAGLRPLIAR